MYKIANIKNRIIVSIVATLFLTYACSKDSESNVKDDEHIGVSFKLSESEFGESETLNIKASANQGKIVNSLNVIQEVKSGPFTVTAELQQDSIAKLARRAASSGTKAVNKPLSLRGAVQYRIVAYGQDGTYIDQAIGDASQPDQLFFQGQLTAGQKYNFVIYSLGSTTEAPPAAPTNNLAAGGDINKALALNFTDFNTEGADFMYAIEKDVTILNSTPTPLTSPLKHLFTKVSILVDNSDATGTYGQPDYKKGGYLSQVQVDGSLSNAGGLNSSSYVDLSTGKVIGGVAQSSFPINNLNATSKTYILNTSGTSSSTVNVTIGAGMIVIGKDINTNPVTVNFASAGLKPGYSYTLKLRFNSDRYINSSNVTRNADATDAQYAVIGGYTWDRYNLGVTDKNPLTNNPDQNPSVQSLYGSYYKWGLSSPSVDTYDGDAAVTGWNSTSGADHAWNSGSETAPVRTSSDPCSAGYRVPTVNDYNILVANTKLTSIGATTTAAFTAASVVTSKKSSEVKLTFPSTGARDPGNGAQVYRGSTGYYWTSLEQLSSVYAYRAAFAKNNTVRTNDLYYRRTGGSLRCIANK